MNIDPIKLENSITKKTKAILIVHLYGQNAVTKRIQDLVKQFNLLLGMANLRT